MAKTKIGSNAPFSGGSKSLVILGERCYHYSGVVFFQGQSGGGSSLFGTFADFYTGKGYTIVTFQYTVMDDGLQANTDEVRVVVKFNGINIFTYIESARTTGEGFTRTQNAWPKLLIPPLTRVEVTMENITDNSNLAGFVCMSGKVYNA